MSEIKEMYVDGDVFVGMDSLQYLRFYNKRDHPRNKVYFYNFWYFLGCIGIEYLPEALKYFHWDGFPAKHLPSNFCAENLIELSLDGSNVKKLWRGEQDVRNLRVISLRGCQDLIKLPDLSKAKNVRKINLSGCKRCQNVPSKFLLEALESLHLSYCLNVRKFPDISSKSLKYLHLEGTNIEEVPSSIESLSGLEMLTMNDCRRLSTISTNICKLKSLESLYFAGCVKLESFPEILEPLEHLKDFWLDGCVNLKIFPSNWYNLKSLGSLLLNDTGITELPMYVGHFNSKNQDLSFLSG